MGNVTGVMWVGCFFGVFFCWFVPPPPPPFLSLLCISLQVPDSQALSFFLRLFHFPAQTQTVVPPL